MNAFLWLAFVITCLLTPYVGLASSWQLRVSPTSGKSFGSQEFATYNSSGASVDLFKLQYQNSWCELRPGLGLSSTDSYAKKNDSGNTYSFNSRQFELMAYAEAKGGPSLTFFQLTPFVQLGLGYGSSQVKYAKNQDEEYLEASYEGQRVNSRRALLGLSAAFLGKTSMMIGYMQVRRNVDLSNRPDSYYIESYGQTGGLSLTTNLGAEQSTGAPKRFSETLHGLQISLVVPL
jgi:hypothetical protein